MSDAAVKFSFSAVASDKFVFGILPTKLFHLLNRVFPLQLGFGSLFQVAVNSLVVGVPVCHQTRRERGSGQTLCDYKGIVPQSFKQFLQHFWLPGVLRHAVHLSLQLLRGNWPLPVILESLGPAQIV